MAAVGFALAPLNRGGRLLYALVSLAVVLPPETFSGAIFINAAGITAAVALPCDRLDAPQAGQDSRGGGDALLSLRA